MYKMSDLITKVIACFTPVAALHTADPKLEGYSHDIMADETVTAFDIVDRNPVPVLDALTSLVNDAINTKDLAFIASYANYVQLLVVDMLEEQVDLPVHNATLQGVCDAVGRVTTVL